MRRSLSIVFLFLAMFGCGDDLTNISSVDERTEAAIEELIDELTDPNNGWKLKYQPTPESGVYLLFMTFDDGGRVVVKSDLADNHGEFFEQTLEYRVDAASGLELVLETYGLFHYLFEQDDASFGAEFEFVFERKDGNNLVFESKTDNIDPTELLFEPAISGGADALSPTLSANLNLFDCNNARILGQGPCVQHIMFNDRDMSLFWSINVARRQIEVDLVGAGTTLDEILANTDNVTINHTTGYFFENGNLVLSEPFTFTLRGEEVTISSITPNTLSLDGDPVCSLGGDATPIMSGTVGGLGSVTIVRSMFDSEGIGFQPKAESNYNVNPIFIFSQNPVMSLLQTGSIFERIPSTVAFILNYGFDSEDQPANAIGFIIEDANRDQTTYLREFEMTTTVGNRIQLTLTDDVYISGVSNDEDRQSVMEITEEILGNGEIFASLVPLDGQDITVFRLMNPCNGYEFFLVQN